VTALADDTRFAFSAIQSELERFLKIAAGDEENLELWYTWALTDSSGWLVNSFTDEDGADTKSGKDVKALKLALFNGVKQLRVTFNKPSGVNKLKTAAVEEGYPGPLVGASKAQETMAAFLYHFRCKVYLL
jgi:hypothetical protein